MGWLLQLHFGPKGLSPEELKDKRFPLTAEECFWPFMAFCVLALLQNDTAKPKQCLYCDGTTWDCVISFYFFPLYGSPSSEKEYVLTNQNGAATLGRSENCDAGWKPWRKVNSSYLSFSSLSAYPQQRRSSGTISSSWCSEQRVKCVGESPWKVPRLSFLCLYWILATNSPVQNIIGSHL